MTTFHIRDITWNQFNRTLDNTQALLSPSTKTIRIQNTEVKDPSFLGLGTRPKW